MQRHLKKKNFHSSFFYFLFLPLLTGHGHAEGPANIPQTTLTKDTTRISQSVDMRLNVTNIDELFAYPFYDQYPPEEMEILKERFELYSEFFHALSDFFAIDTDAESCLSPQTLHSFIEDETKARHAFLNNQNLWDSVTRMACECIRPEGFYIPDEDLLAHPGGDFNWLFAYYRYDQARQELGEQSNPDGTAVDYYRDTSDPSQRACQIFADQLYRMRQELDGLELLSTRSGEEEKRYTHLSKMIDVFSRLLDLVDEINLLLVHEDILLSKEEEQKREESSQSRRLSIFSVGPDFLRQNMLSNIAFAAISCSIAYFTYRYGTSRNRSQIRNLPTSIAEKSKDMEIIGQIAKVAGIAEEDPDLKSVRDRLSQIHNLSNNQLRAIAKSFSEYINKRTSKEGIPSQDIYNQFADTLGGSWSDFFHKLYHLGNLGSGPTQRALKAALADFKQAATQGPVQQ